MIFYVPPDHISTVNVSEMGLERNFGFSGFFLGLGF